MLQHMVIKEKENENMSTLDEMGHTIQGNIDTTRKLTRGLLFESRHIILDKDVRRIHQRKEKRKTTRKGGHSQK